MNIFFILFLGIFTTNSYALSLRFIADQNFPTGLKFKETELGGLSGIVFDESKNRFYAICDDRSKINPARFYEFELKISENSLEVTPSNVTFLKNKEGEHFKNNEIDFEGITIINNNFIISSEGSINKIKPIMPAIFEFTRDGSFVKNFEVPSKFLPDQNGKDVKYGARDNLVFEALSGLNTSSSFLVGTEEALLQDGSISTPSHSSHVRLLKFDLGLLKKEMAYKLDQVPSMSVAGLVVGETGLVDFALIDENESFSMERAFLPLSKKTFIKVFKISNLESATNISEFDSLEKKTYTPVTKELVLDLETIIPKLSKDFQSLDNIEGIAIGPKLKNGNRTLILVSDNNFSKFQRTQFIAFEIIP